MMGFLFNNPIANMHGPTFLWFYTVVAFSFALVGWFVVRGADKSGNRKPPKVPRDPDPYLLAYLRGGENEVIRLGILSLLQRGYIEQSDDGFEPLRHHPPLRHLDEIEETIFDYIDEKDYTVTPSILFGSTLLADKVGEYCDEFEDIGQREQFLMPESAIRTANIMRWLGTWGLLGLGAYKIIVAFSRGRHNVIFLIFMMVIFNIILRAILNVDRLSKRGKAYFEQLELAHARIRDRITEYEEDDPAFLLGASIFGLMILQGSVFDYYPGMFHVGAVSGSCGAGCGSCGSSCGSSCGGSCGGGCGGGCGGCGGCG
jgi:uncharacterized protein (TIGR04222 family)